MGNKSGWCSTVRTEADELVGGAPKYSSIHCGVSSHILDTPYSEDVTYSVLEVREVLGICVVLLFHVGVG